MTDFEPELVAAVKKALALLIATLPYPKDASRDLSAAWCIVLADEGIKAYQVEAAMVEALKLEAFPPPIVFARICHRHRRQFLLPESACLPINTAAPALEPRSQETMKEHMDTIRLKAAMPDPDLEDPEQAERIRRQVERLKQERKPIAATETHEGSIMEQSA